jgi:hypothetical protein
MLVIPPSPASKEPGKPPIVTVVIAALVAMAIAVSLWVLLKRPQENPTGVAQVNVPAKMNQTARAYAKALHIENVALSRAENFIHQQVTILNAEVVNDGPQTVQKLFVTVEFLDDMHQVVLRETRGVLGTPPTPLAPGQRRSFEISFDRVPASWNMQQPAVTVAGLELGSEK